MPELLKVSIKGSMPSGEVWSINPVFSTPTEPTLSFDELNTIATAINAISPGAQLQQLQTNTTFITGVRLEQRERDGQLVAQIEQNRTTPLSGGGATAHPAQTSMVFSLITNYPGGSGRGRLYWPGTAGAISATNLRYSPSDVPSAVAQMKTYLSAIETAITAVATAADLVVWSRTQTAYHQVVKLRAGDVPDTQRRRRDKFVETYSSVSYP